MKKLILVMIAVIGLSFAAQAQNAIGIRLGGGQGFNSELSFQKGLGAGRLEADLGYNLRDHVGAISLALLYQVHFDIAAVPNLGWYAGVGGKLLMYNAEGVGSKLNLGAVGQLGLDYYFKALPIQASLDIRPCFYVYPATAFQWGDIALGIRYVF